MPEAYELHEARYIQMRELASAADALFVDVGTVPEGKVWTILSAYYVPSVIETRYIWWAVLGRNGIAYPVSDLISIPLSSAIPFGLLTEGMEIRLFPGEKLRMNRAVATAASTMTIGIRFIESDLPFYAYEEPLNKVVRTKLAHGSVFKRFGQLSTGSGSGSSGGGESGSGGKSGGPLPI